MKDGFNSRDPDQIVAKVFINFTKIYPFFYFGIQIQHTDTDFRHQSYDEVRRSGDVKISSFIEISARSYCIVTLGFRV